LPDGPVTGWEILGHVPLMHWPEVGVFVDGPRGLVRLVASPLDPAETAAFGGRAYWHEWQLPGAVDASTAVCLMTVRSHFYARFDAAVAAV
jgi:hypothetical protein